MQQQEFKRNIAYKYRIGQLLSATQTMEGEKLKHLECEGKKVVRCNIIANIVDKYVQEGEKKFASLTLDDGTGQLKVKTFGEDIEKVTPYNQGDTILVIGLVRSWNNELYLTPDIIKKKETSYLLIRKLESEQAFPKKAKGENMQLKDTLLLLVKEAEKEQGIDIEKVVIELKEHPSLVNQEIKKLLEEGVIYEPRQGRLRYLG